MNLRDLSKGKKAKILGYADGLSQQLKQRLQDLGFNQDEVVTCQKNIPFGGPSVYVLNHSVFSIESDLARSVLIEEVELG